MQFDSNYDNKKYRVRQTTQLVEEILKASTADVIFLGGDFNAGPHSKPYQIVQAYMKNSIEDVYWKLRAWLQPKWATYANEKVSMSTRPCGLLELTKCQTFRVEALVTYALYEGVTSMALVTYCII